MFSKPTRNHISIVLEQIGAAGVVVLTFAYSAVYEAFTSGQNIFSKQFWLRLVYSVVGSQNETVAVIFGVAAVFVVLIPLWSLIRWYKTCFYIDGEHLVCERNTLMKKSSRLPLSSIATVNLERNIFERIVGTAKIKLDINSAATASQTDFTFVLSLEKAKALEAALLSAKKEEQTHNETKETVFAFTNAQAVRHVILSQPVVQFMGIAALVVIGAFLDREFLGGDMLTRTAPILGLSLLGWLAKIVMQIMSACQFKIERDENSIFISSGLLRKKNYSFEKDKINALTVRRPVLARLFGLAFAEVAVIGLGNDKKETPQISLLVKENELEKILAVCASDFNCTGERMPEHKTGLIAAMAKYLLGFGAVGVAAAFVWLPLCPVIILLGALFAVFSHKAKALCADENIFSYSQGFLSRKSCFFKYGDIQTVHFSSNAIMKRFGTGRITLSILSHSSMSVHSTVWAEKEVFVKLSQKVINGYNFKN
ncbi:MAG: PH domain-containing protein [Clostridia bacterium]|nr:PH domain-containing protein [Clostridia bacterium]